MTSSAVNRTADSDILDRTLELYRDLTVALMERIALVRAGASDKDTDCKATEAAVKGHQRTLQTVLEIEASLEKRSRPRAGGAGELDLAAARGEIVARLALWEADG